MSLAKEIFRNCAIALLVLGGCTPGSSPTTTTPDNKLSSSGEQASHSTALAAESRSESQLTLEALGIIRFSRQIFLIDPKWNRDRAVGLYGLDSPAILRALQYIGDRCDVRSVANVGGKEEIGESFPRNIIAVVVTDGACIPEG